MVPQGSRIQPLDPSTGVMSLLVRAPFCRIVPSMLGLSFWFPWALEGRIWPLLYHPAPPSCSQAKAQQLDFFFCDSM